MRFTPVHMFSIALLLLAPHGALAQGGDPRAGDAGRMVVNARAAAERGDRDAQAALGGAYLHGKGVPQDDAEALKWLRLAAERGQALAQFDMGELYRTGRGVPKDEVEAVRWYLRSASQGNAFGQHNLGISHCVGLGGLKSDKVACAMWLSLAAAQGYRAASLRDTERSMSPEDIARSRRLADEWKPVVEPPPAQ